MFLRCGGSLNVCDLVFIVVHDEEKSDVSISRLYLDDTGSRCLANTIVITDIRIAACEILPVRKKEADIRLGCVLWAPALSDCFYNIQLIRCQTLVVSCLPVHLTFSTTAIRVRSKVAPCRAAGRAAK